MAKKKPTRVGKKLTAERRARILESLRQGNYREVAARSVGITARTLRNWVAAGESGNPSYASFAQEVREAEANVEAIVVNSLVKAATEGGDWKAGAWYLERKYKRRWSREQVAEESSDQPVEAAADIAAKARAAVAAQFGAVTPTSGAEGDALDGADSPEP